ncbi:hypothetical protein EVAR_14442_1 [Eumeta japonica]|uniref:Uncharacterized protein n=1 Tax=Eumeta variegata TaxID=151549 RepID=A0A4C1TXB0_EUMVA|nr:hypothetical protein EVAR_14442_1 [Eumeta japonica]
MYAEITEGSAGCKAEGGGFGRDSDGERSDQRKSKADMDRALPFGMNSKVPTFSQENGRKLFWHTTYARESSQRLVMPRRAFLAEAGIVRTLLE